MHQVMARPAQPGEVVFEIVPALTPKFSVVGMNSGPLLALVAGLARVLKPEAAQELGVSNAG